MRQDGELFASGQQDGRGAGTVRSRIGFDPALDHRHDGFGLLLIDIEFGSYRAHLGIARPHHEGPLLVLRHVKQRLALDQRHIAPPVGQANLDSRSRVELDSRAVQELNGSLFADPGGIGTRRVRGDPKQEQPQWTPTGRGRLRPVRDIATACAKPRGSATRLGGDSRGFTGDSGMTSGSARARAMRDAMSSLPSGSELGSSDQTPDTSR